MSEEPNGRVTTRMLYREIDTVKELFRAELGGVRASLDESADKLDAICKRLNARPARSWLGGRATAALDKLAPLGLIALITWLLTQ